MSSMTYEQAYALYHPYELGQMKHLCSKQAVKIDKLRDENAALRTQLADVTESMGRVEERCAELRKLAKKLVILAFARCADCDLLDASCTLAPTQKCLLWNECESAARELGVEVP